MKFAFIVALVLLAIASVAYLVIPADYPYKEKIANHTYDIISLLTIILVFRAFRLTTPKSRDSRRWLFLFLGVLFWFMGDVIWTVFIYLGKDPMISLADVFYVIGYVSVLVATFIKYLNIKSLASKGDYLNSIFVMSCILVVMTHFILMPMAMSDEPLINKVLMIFYPVIDAIIVLFTVIIMAASDFQEKSLPWLGICIGIALWTIADTMTTYLEWQGTESWLVSFSNVIFVAGLLAIGVGAFYRKIVYKDIGA